VVYPACPTRHALLSSCNNVPLTRASPGLVALSSSIGWGEQITFLRSHQGTESPVSDRIGAFSGGRDKPATKVIYVLGSARGGTSIAGRLMGLIEDAALVEELRRLWSKGLRPGRTCGCGTPHSECEVWSELLVEGASYLEPSLDEVGRLQETAAPGEHPWWHTLGILRSAVPPPLTTAKGRYLEIYCDLYRAFARATGSSVLIDTSKNAVDAALLAFASQVSTYCVQVVRDPRGVLFSRRKRTAQDPTRANPWKAIRATLHWLTRQLAAEAVRRRFGPQRSLVVRYEQFIEAPSQTLAAVSRLVSVGPPKSQLSAGIAIEMPAAHGPDGNGRFSAGTIILQKDVRWEKELHPFDRFLVTLIAYPLLRRYGYPIRPRGRYRLSMP
jgi:hypothetical protein